MSNFPSLNNPALSGRIYWKVMDEGRGLLVLSLDEVAEMCGATLEETYAAAYKNSKRCTGLRAEFTVNGVSVYTYEG